MTPQAKVERQPRLPGFEVVGKEKKRHFPQPRTDRFRDLKWYELLHHPLDLGFRGRLNLWLDRVQEEHDFELTEVLSNYYLQIVQLYLYPQPPDNKWLNQAQVMAQVRGESKANLRQPLIFSLIKVWRRIRYGPKAIEILKFELEDSFIYKSIVSHKINTIDELAGCSSEDLRIICGARPMFEKLKQYMEPFFSDWNPELVFRQELSSEKAFKI